MARLLDKYIAEKDNKNSEKLSQEIDNIEIVRLHYHMLYLAFIYKGYLRRND